MTDNVVSFADAKAAREPHYTGENRCLECGHEWVAVRPVATETWWLECPSCGLHKGRPIGPYKREMPHWTCNCGNDLFCITPHGPYCPHCGVWFTPN
jgi:hypothetical protein